MRRIALTSTVSRTLQIGLRALQVPLALQFLTLSEYGAWLAIANFIAFFSITDLGVGQAATQQMTTQIARGEPTAARRTTTSLVLIYLMLAVFCLIATTFLAATNRIQLFLGLTSKSTSPATIALVILALSASTALQLISRSGLTINDVLLKSDWNYLGMLGGSVVTGVLLLILAYCKGGGLGSFAISMSMPPAVAACAITVLTFKREPELRPRRSELSSSALRLLLVNALPLFFVQLFDYAIYYLPVILIAKAFGLDQIAAYSIPVGIFMCAVNLLAAARQPYAVVYRTALEHDDIKWVILQHTKIMCSTLSAYIGLSFLVVINSKYIYQILTHGKINVNMGLLISQSVYFGLLLLMQLNANLLLGAGLNKIKAVLHCINAITVVACFVYLARIASLTACVYACCLVFSVDCIASLFVLHFLNRCFENRALAMRCAGAT